MNKSVSTRRWWWPRCTIHVLLWACATSLLIIAAFRANPSEDGHRIRLAQTCWIRSSIEMQGPEGIRGWVWKPLYKAIYQLLFTSLTSTTFLTLCTETEFLNLKDTVAISIWEFHRKAPKEGNIVILALVVKTQEEKDCSNRLSCL